MTAPGDELLPCPFCPGGTTQVIPTNHWTGMRNTVIAVHVTHWCDRPEGQPQSLIKIAGKTEQEARAAWNRRVSHPQPSPDAEEAFKQIVDAEPELPGEMPDGMYYKIKMMFETGDREGVTEAFRIVARQTKRGIKQRALQYLKSQPSGRGGGAYKYPLSRMTKH